MSTPGRPKGESLSAQREGCPVSAPREDGPSTAVRDAHVPGAVLLAAESVSRRFGGLVAVDQVSLQLARGAAGSSASRRRRAA